MRLNDVIYRRTWAHFWNSRRFLAPTQDSDAFLLNTFFQSFRFLCSLWASVSFSGTSGFASQPSWHACERNKNIFPGYPYSNSSWENTFYISQPGGQCKYCGYTCIYIHLNLNMSIEYMNVDHQISSMRFEKLQQHTDLYRMSTKMIRYLMDSLPAHIRLGCFSPQRFFQSLFPMFPLGLRFVFRCIWLWFLAR